MGGPIALVEDGDVIEIDIYQKRIFLEVGKKTLQERARKWKEPPPKIKRGYLRRYAKLVSSATSGATLIE